MPLPGRFRFEHASPTARSIAFSVGCSVAIGGLWTIVRVARRDDRLLTSFASTMPLLLFVAGIATAGWFAVTRPDERSLGSAPQCCGRQVATGALGLALAAWGAILIMSARWSAGQHDALVAASWLISMVALALGARGYRNPVSSQADWTLNEPASIASRLRTHIPELGVFTVALVTRTVALGSYPYIVDGDGAAFALYARQVGHELTDPFTTGYLDHPTFFAFVQRSVMWVVGSEGLAAARLTSALAGTGAVVMTYLFARRIAGRRVALVSAALLALMPMHIFYSRVALNNAFDSLFLPATLWLLDRAFVEGRRTDAVLAGMCVGLAQYFYFGSRLLVPVVVVYAVFQVWRVSTSDESLGPALRSIGWAVAGAVVAYTPLGLHYLAEPQDFNSRLDSVSFFGAYLDAERAATGSSTFALVARQLGSAFALPFSDSFVLAGYSPPAPTIGWVFAIPAAIGLGAVTIRPLSRRHFPVALVWWGSLAAISLTLGPSTNRWVIATPVVAIVAAMGLDTTIRTISPLVPAATGRLFGRLGGDVGYLAPAAALVVLAAVVGAGSYFATIEGLDDNGDVNSLVATELGHRWADDPGATIVAAFRPRMGLRSHATIELLAPKGFGFDLDTPMSSVDDVPDVSGPTVFAFLPERLGELDFVQTKYPNGQRTNVSRYGVDLYTTYRVN